MNKIKRTLFSVLFLKQDRLFQVRLFSVFFDIIETLISRIGIGRENEPFIKRYE